VALRFVSIVLASSQRRPSSPPAPSSGRRRSARRPLPACRASRASTLLERVRRLNGGQVLTRGALSSGGPRAVQPRRYPAHFPSCQDLPQSSRCSVRCWPEGVSRTSVRIVLRLLPPSARMIRLKTTIPIPTRSRMTCRAPNPLQIGASSRGVASPSRSGSRSPVGGTAGTVQSRHPSPGPVHRAVGNAAPAADSLWQSCPDAHPRDS
jgi:hypothetical protein